MDAAWQPEGYTSPHPVTYRWQWLWDSCFHAVVWATLGDERSIAEMTALFTHQADDGFVPHMGYHGAPEAAVTLWGRPAASTITQPPMYPHALRVLAAHGFEPSPELVQRAGAGLEFLWAERMRDGGLLVVVHPWETGCDDSPRWDSWAPQPFVKAGWDEKKRELVASLRTNREGSAVANPAFEVTSMAFNAVCAFNAFEYAALAGSDRWRHRGDELARRIAARWDPDHQTFVDGDHGSGAVPTLEALLALLVVEGSHPAWEPVADPDRFAARYGLRGLDRRHPAYRPDAYWRGPTWPQLDYLLWVASVRAGRGDEARTIVEATLRGAVASGFAEYWNPDTGAGHGAVPQSWTGLVLPMVEGVGP